MLINKHLVHIFPNLAKRHFSITKTSDIVIVFLTSIYNVHCVPGNHRCHMFVGNHQGDGNI